MTEDTIKPMKSKTNRNRLLKRKAHLNISKIKKKKYDSDDETEVVDTVDETEVVDTVDETEVVDTVDETEVVDTVEKPEGDSASSGDEEIAGNAGWADAMAKVLGTSTALKRNFILSKAKKEKKATTETRKPEVNDDITIVKDDAETVEPTSNVESVSPPDSPENWKEKLEKKKIRETLGRKKPNIVEREHERNLMRIATRGVVQLFNAVKQQQSALQQKLKSVGPSEMKKDEVVRNSDKDRGSFLDMLKKKCALKSEETSTADNDEVMETKSTMWEALRNDFMLGAKMKDWDKDDDE